MKTLHAVLAMVLALTASAVYAQTGEASLQPGDNITISVSHIPEKEAAQVRGTYTVAATGSVTLPYIGEVRASGLKPSALQRTIEQTYIDRKIYTRPIVLVSSNE